MKLKFLVVTCAITAVCVVACKSSKKATKPADVVAASASKNDEPAIQMDTIEVLSNNPPKKSVYQAANTVLHNILHTKLEVSFDWTKSQLIGIANLTIKPKFFASDKLFLDARGMELKEVSVVNSPTDKSLQSKSSAVVTGAIANRRNLNYVYENDSIKIKLDRVYTSNETFTVYISYISKPNELKVGGSSAISSDKGLYFVNPLGLDMYKMPQIWTQGETQASSAWFPTIDSPNQKTTQEILMTVDNQFTTLSNGTLVKSTKNADNSRTDHWKLDLPHAPYLAMMAVGRFVKVVDEPWKGKEISYYVEKEYEPHAKAIFGDTKEMIDFFSKKMGVDYPWPKYAQVVARDYVSGAMENTSATLHGEAAVYQTSRETLDNNKGTDIISHELFHQWFGDLVTCESWSNLPLNESFATYGEYLWREYKDGRDAADLHHKQSRMSYLFSNKEVDVIRFNYEDKEDMFDGFSYAKGGQILHMLRKAVGDDAFFASLKNYLETNKFKTAEIHNLRLAFEETTGQDLNWFFNQWFLNSGRPKLKVTKALSASGNELALTIEQNQNFKKVPLYTLPIDIDVYSNGKVARTRIWVTEQKQTVTLKTDGAPQLVNFDAERQLLCDLDYVNSKEEYLFQYKNAPLYEDRFEALKELEKNINDADVQALYLNAATNDKLPALRNNCINKLHLINDKSTAKATLVSIYNNDKKTIVKAEALQKLNKLFGSDADVQTMNEAALTHPSYAVIAEALDGIIKVNPKLAMEKAKNLEIESGKDVIFKIADLYANNGSDAQIGYYRSVLKYMCGFEVPSFCSLYAKCAKRCEKSESAIIASQDFESLCKSGNKFSKYGAQKGLKDLLSVWEAKEKAAIAANAANVKTITETREIIAKAYAATK